MTTWTVDASTAQLADEGFGAGSIAAAWDHLVMADSWELPQPDEGHVVSDAELDLMRDMMRVWARDAVLTATEEREDALAGIERRWRQSITRALATPGVGATEVARLAGISRERVYQIRDGRR